MGYNKPMPTPLLATKLYIPSLRPKVVHRPRLIERLNKALHQNQGFSRKLTLISAPAGFGKTTLVSSWLNQVAGAQSSNGGEEKNISPAPLLPHPSAGVAWLSLDEGDNDLTRFLAYLIAALQTVAPKLGAGVLAALQSPQPPSTESILTSLLNEIAGRPSTSSGHGPSTSSGHGFVLVLDDYHVIQTPAVDRALAFLLEHLPPRLHLVIVTREDPPLPLARYRVRSQLTELRATDLRFTPAEAAEFLNQIMGLNLSAEDVTTLEARTEGWIAGLQLAALALQGTSSKPAPADAAGFINSFSGSHHFVLDYLLEEVLHRQPASIQTFLLLTSILDRLCGPLCDAVLGPGEGPPALPLPGSGQETLEYLEQANLFLVPLDNERRWYRYHHLFADLLRQRLHQNPPALARSTGECVAELHRRASLWYEANGLELEAFQHAAAAHDLDRAERLIEGGGMPLHFRGAVTPVLHWLESLPKTVLDARPSLWVTYASALSIAGQNSRVEETLQAAEAALPDGEPDEQTRNLIGHIAAIRALLAATQYQVETLIAQSRRALEYLHPDNLPVRTATTWKLGLAYQYQGDRAAAAQAYTEAIAISQASGNVFVNILATTGLGLIQEADNQLYQAAESYRRVLVLVGDPPPPAACEAVLGLARLAYQWNDLEAAHRHGQESLHLARQIELIDSSVACEVFLARLKLVQGDVAGATALLAEASQDARRHNFVQQLPEVAAGQVLTMLRQGRLTAAAQLAESHDLPLSRARVHLAQGDPVAALALLEPARRQAEARAWADEQLKALVLQAIAHQAHGDQDQALQRLADAFTLAEPGGFIRLFIDEGEPLADLLAAAAARGLRPDYTGRLLAAFAGPPPARSQATTSSLPAPPPSLVEPLSDRELEVLHLIAAGLSNREICERLVLALSTVKGHNRVIFGKLQVQRRTEAVARARALGLL